MNDKEQYLAVLDQCKKVASAEFKVAKYYSKQCNDIVKDLNKRLDSVVLDAQKVTQAEKMSGNGLNDMVHQLGAAYQIQRESQKQGLNKQKKALSKFSIMLFGQTMVGKSTIREAITHGDGSTIGKGAQRTTRDVREYEWNNLRIIDTPGFGAYDGEEDTEIARGILEQSDIILFMLKSDSIQETTFTELEYVKKLNKPLVFVINMKKNLEKKIHRKKVLKDMGASLYSADALDGHIQRLKQKSADIGLNPSSITVIPIHAQAAFLSTQTEFKDEADKLYQLSRMQDLLDFITEEITSKGPVRRIQTLLDAALNHADSLEKTLFSQEQSVRALLRQYEYGLKRLYQWHEKAKKQIPERIDSDIDKIYNPLINSVSRFVDDNITCSDVSDRWLEHMESFKIESKVKQINKQIVDDIQQELEQFNRDLNRSINLSSNLTKETTKGAYNPVDYKRLNGWGGVLTTALLSVGMANSWNPVGLVLLGVVSGVFAFFNWFSDSKNKKLQAEKKKQAAAIRKELGEQKEETKKGLKEWFIKEVEGKQMVSIKSDLQALCTGLNDFQLSIAEAVLKVDGLQQDINKRWLTLSAKALGAELGRLPEIERIVRQPGYACYFTVSNYFKNSELINTLQNVLGEKIKVVYNGSVESKIRHILGLRDENIKIVEEQGAYHIYAPSDQIGRIIGKQQRQIMLVSAICNVKLFTKPIETYREVCA